MQVLAGVAAALLASLLALGTRLQVRRQGAGRGKWLHHLLFFAVTALQLLLSALQWRRGQPFGALLLGAALLLAMPLTCAGRPAHWRLALVAALACGWSLWGVWLT